MSNETGNTDAEKAATLAAAGKKAEQQKKEKQERTVKGAHLLDQLKTLAADATLALKQGETNGFIVLNGAAKGKRVLIGKKGGRVDLSGFTIEADAVRQVSEQEARDKHLGKVRAQIDFNKDDAEVLAVFSKALAELNVALPEPEKKPAKAKKTVEEQVADQAEAENAAEAKVS